MRSLQAASGLTASMCVLSRGTDEGDFIEPCQLPAGCPYLPERCFPSSENTICILTPAIEADPSASPPVAAQPGFCSVDDAASTDPSGTCSHQPAEDEEAPPQEIAAIGGLYFESESTSSSFRHTMYLDKNIAIGAKHTFFAVFTQADTAGAYGTLLGFRPNNGPGVFAFNAGAGVGCAGVACMFTDDWMPSGYLGNVIQPGVPSIGVYRSSLVYNSVGVLGPVTEFALITNNSRDVVWSSSLYANGLEEYDYSVQENYDYDFRDPDVDGDRAVARGYGMLGHWALPCEYSYMHMCSLSLSLSLSLSPSHSNHCF
eukprot:COSAG02_NODE_200_length_29507_cov_440.183487_11_plen_315_part_00